MKRLLLLITAFFTSQFIFAQDKEIPEEIIYKDSVVDAQPEFPGGIDGLYKYFETNLVKPKVNSLVDKVVLSFIVEKDGSLSDIRIIHDAGFGTGDQAQRLLENGPKWQPATKDGKKVRVHQQIPIAVVTED